MGINMRWWGCVEGSGAVVVIYERIVGSAALEEGKRGVRQIAPLRDLYHLGSVMIFNSQFSERGVGHVTQ